MNLPPDFISTITNTFGADGKRFIAELPALVEEASARWGLTNIQPVSNLSYNFVAFAESPSPFGRGVRGEGDRPSTAALRASAQDVVLKIGVPRDELASEIAALRLFDGEGACRLIDCDDEKGFLLLERLQPGVMLSTLDDDEEATRIAAEVMKRVWRPLERVTLPKEHRDDVSDSEGSLTLPTRLFGRGARRHSLRVTYNKFIQLTDWFDGLKRLREIFNGGTGPLDERLVERVERSTKDFFVENHNPVLMHGDFHHFNILSSERGWLVIDPKGVIGPAGYEVGPLMMNPWEELPQGNSLKVRVKRRIDILHEQLGFERERIREWSLAHTVLSAWWSIEDQGDWRYAVNFAEMIASL